MQFDNFQRIVTTFADEDNEVVVEEGHLLLSIRGELVEAEIRIDPLDGVKVVYEGEEWSARRWIHSYLAKLNMLADRIIDYIDPPKNYVSPSVDLLDWRDESIKKESSSDSTTSLREMLAKSPGGTTSVYFLTSDAGEGKTSLIEKISVEQAKAFKNRETGTLILPVSLGGRSFLRFDDVVIASLMNRLRFPYLYYESFIELIRMSAIIPAFDGFEEVLVDVQSNEAASAVGHLVNQLSSCGTILIAARKAYFDRSLNSQVKLLDSIRSENEAQIQRLVLNRWGRKVFTEYVTLREYPEPDSLYELVKNRLERSDHPLLTRAVLVQRLVDVAQDEGGDLDKFLRRLGQSQVDYFFDFIETIVEREVNEKWITRSGTDHSPLLTLDEHHELLSQIASEMWINAVDALKFDVIELILELFAAEKDKSSDVERQMSKRIMDHPLLHEDKSLGTSRNITRICFDHEDFQEFYLGQALARALLSSNDSFDTKLILDAGKLTKPVILETARYLKNQEVKSIDEVMMNLECISQKERQVSYIRENCGILMLEFAQYATQSHSIREVHFPAHALKNRILKDLQVHNCTFDSTRLDHSKITNCSFHGCRFWELVLDDSKALSMNKTEFHSCTFDCVSIVSSSEEEPREFREPKQKRAILENKGFDLNLKPQSTTILNDIHSPQMDNDMKVAMKFIKMFHRATTVNENAITQRLRNQTNHFMDKILPELTDAKLVENTGKSQNKYRLKVPRSKIDNFLRDSGNTFSEFIRMASV